jgi:hypothetical protein
MPPLDSDTPTKGDALKMVKKKVSNMNQALTTIEGVLALAQHYGIPMRRDFNPGMGAKKHVEMSQKLQELFKDVKAGDLLKDKNNRLQALKDKILLADKIMDGYAAEPNEIIEAAPEKRGRKKQEQDLTLKGDMALETILADAEKDIMDRAEVGPNAEELAELEEGLAGIERALAKRKEKARAAHEARAKNRKGKTNELDAEIAIEPDQDIRNDKRDGFSRVEYCEQESSAYW